MRYLIISKDPVTGKQDAFYTKWFDFENLYNPEYKVIVVDLVEDKITFDGNNLEDIQYDHL